MTQQQPRCILGTAVAVCLVGAGHLSHACTVPVYQWAFLNWEPDLYPVLVFTSGALTEDDEAALQALRTAAEEMPRANIALQVVELSEPLDGYAEAVWQSEDRPQAPFLVARLPIQIPLNTSLWSGPLTVEAVQAILESPARSRIAELLNQGSPAVWVLLESGDPQKDHAARETLEREIQRPVQPPEPAPATFSAGIPAAPAASAAPFALVTVSRNDPNESVLVDMLLRSEPDLLSYAEPMVFPVFGRGRALYALVGLGINAANIAEACAFVTGVCSCVVKDGNPGVDLLMRTQWDISRYEQSDPIAVPPPQPASLAKEQREPAFWLLVLAALAGSFVVLGMVTFLRVLVLRRRRQLPGRTI